MAVSLPQQAGPSNPRCAIERRPARAALQPTFLSPGAARLVEVASNTMTLPLEGLLVVAMELAVAAPLCSVRLADAGARVIKIERPEGDFCRGFDNAVHGESAYFVWLNRGKESVALDLTRDEDKALFEALLAKADVFVQNLKPGAIGKLGFDIARLRRDYPRLITCSVSGYGESGPYAQRKAYDLLIQAESGLAWSTGTRVGVSVVDIATGLNAHEAVLEALLGRSRSGEGTAISISMFDSVTDWMTVPLLQHEGGKTPQRLGLAHPTIAPYGVFKSKDNADILISAGNDREWVTFARDVMGDPALARNPDFAKNVQRVENRTETDRLVGAAFATMTVDELSDKLAKAQIGFARLSDPDLLGHHPQLRRITVGTPTGPVAYPAPPMRLAGEDRHYGPVPSIGQHTDKVKAEFVGTPKRTARAKPEPVA
jgi:itaconate CoA-transferase